MQKQQEGACTVAGLAEYDYIGQLANLPGQLQHFSNHSLCEL